MKKTYGFIGLGVASLLFLSIGGCDDPFATCTEGFDCPGDGDGRKSGGTSNSGGESNGTGSSDGSGGLAGGTSNSGGAGNSGGSSNPSGGNGSGGENLGGACGDNCTDEKPHCIEDEGTCVECTKHAHCDNPAKPVCGLKNTCDPCRTNADCKDVLGLTDTPVCVNDLGLDDFGKCVGCLTETDCGGNICDPTTKTCLELPFRKKSLCAPCEHDLECKVGEYCVPQVFGGTTIGNFCTQTKEARVGAEGNCSAEGAPFADNKELTSVGGVTARFCVLRTTTCLAYSDHSQQPTGCAASQLDSACGAPDVNDGLCRQKDGETTFFCTYRCGSDVDCLIKGTQWACLDKGEEKYCSF
jgi:hypothetical protein